MIFQFFFEKLVSPNFRDVAVLDLFLSPSDDPGIRVVHHFVYIVAVNQRNKVARIVDSVSFKGADVKDKVETLEAMIVQDADRLDAIGAIGIARAFAYGGAKGQAMYDPRLDPTMHTTFEDYVNSKTTSINHFNF